VRSQESERSHICVLGISILPISMIFLVNFGTVPTMWVKNISNIYSSSCMLDLQLPMCNWFLSSLKLWIRIPLRRGVLDTTLCDKVCQWHATGRWYSPVLHPSVVQLTMKSFTYHVESFICLSVCLLDVVKCHFQQYFSYIVAVSFIGGGNHVLWLPVNSRRIATSMYVLEHWKCAQF
jgi:hypothetical protein